MATNPLTGSSGPESPNHADDGLERISRILARWLADVAVNASAGDYGRLKPDPQPDSAPPTSRPDRQTPPDAAPAAPKP